MKNEKFITMNNYELLLITTNNIKFRISAFTHERIDASTKNWRF